MVGWQSTYKPTTSHPGYSSPQYSCFLINVARGLEPLDHFLPSLQVLCLKYRIPFVYCYKMGKCGKVALRCTLTRLRESCRRI